MRDIFFHSQWCAALAMVAVEWPGFACEFHPFYFIIFRAEVPFLRPHSCTDLMGYALL